MRLKLKPSAAPYVLISPFLLLFMVFGLFPIVFSFVLMFHTWDPVQGLGTMQFVGLDQIVDQIIKKLGNLDQVYLTGDLAEGKNSPFVDLIIVGEVDKPYLYQLIEKAEPLVQKKIRVGVYKDKEFKANILESVGVFMKLVG